MKKLVCLLLILSFAFSLVGCKSSKASINGVNLKSFSIVYSDEDYDYSKRAAEYIKEEISARTGLDLPLIEDSEEAKTENEIVVGNTDRDISKKLEAETEGLEFAIMADESSIALEGDYFIIAAATYFFVETYIADGKSNTTVPAEICIHEPIVKEAKNFILLIGDGMGVYQTQMFDYLDNNAEYGDGEDMFYGYLLPYHGYSRTNSLSGTTDSAAGGTALACGIKTFNEYIGKDKDQNDVKSLTELAHELGMGAGVMSTETDTGATPSAFSAHAFDRDSSSEIRKSQAEARQKYGTVIECGYNGFNQKNITYIENLFEETISTISANEKSFFLMYEEAYIDKNCHNNDIAKTFDCVVRFNQIIARAMEYAFYNPETMIIITADHETGDLKPSEDGTLTYSTTEHTSADVPVFAYGKGAELFDGKTVENIQIAHTIAALMGNDNFGDQSVYQSLTK